MPPYGYDFCCIYYKDKQESSRTYLPQVKLDAHVTVLSTASQTVFKQSFLNTSNDKSLDEVVYVFPLYDGASIVDFKCTIGDRTIFGLVKEREEAKKTYDEAKKRGEKAALLEQLPQMADVFTTTIGNIPAAATVDVTITYIQELKHDAEVDGIRLTIPTHVAPRYGSYYDSALKMDEVDDSGGISVTVDASMGEEAPIKKILSPSHPIEVSLGSLSNTTPEENPSTSKASAALALGSAQLTKDFVLQIVAKDIGVPQAILETHSTLPNQRALMATLVPKFNLKPQKPEIIFIADRSGSMEGNVKTLISALHVFLKSIPIGCMFNIVSFGFNYEFLWPKSKLYGKETLAEAIAYVSKFGADFGGTETLQAITAAIDNRNEALSTELMLLTDGDIYSQKSLFEYVKRQTDSGDVRVFPIGIGGGVSSSLIEGVARAGKGFAQMVGNNEKLDGKIVRMLKGALMPHIKDYQLEIKYEDDSVDSVAENIRMNLHIDEPKQGAEATGESSAAEDPKAPISLYDPEAKEAHPKEEDSKLAQVELPKFDRPRILQTPHDIPALYPFNRTCVYLLLSPEASKLTPKSVILKATSPDGPLQLEIPVQVKMQPAAMIHQLAARKATQELEEGGGWLSGAKTATGDDVESKFPIQCELLRKREAVRLGVEFQVGGKYCSFVAVEANEAKITEARRKALAKVATGVQDAEGEDWELIDYDARIQANQGSNNSATGVYGRGKAGKGLGMGGALRHRKIAPLNAYEEDDDSDEYRGFGLFDGDEPAGNMKVPVRKPLAAMAARKSAPSFMGVGIEAEADDDDEEEEEEEAAEDKSPSDSSDEERGYALFESPPRKMAKLDGDEDADLEERTLLQRLIAKQSFEGSWEFEPLPWGSIHVEKDAANMVIDDAMANHNGLDREVVTAVVATALVVQFFEIKLGEDEETWELVADKAREWLGGALDKDVLDEVLENINALFKM